MIIAEATQHDEQVALAEQLMDKKEFKAAAFEVLEELEPSLETIPQAALVKERALTTHVLTEMSEKGELPPAETFDAIRKVYELSRKLNPDCDFTKEEMTAKADFDVLMVGVGAAGTGCALMLTKTFGVDKSRVVLMEQGEHVGQIFRNWDEVHLTLLEPAGLNGFFDLNAIANGTSPAYTLHTEHPSGSEYADYLSAIAKTTKLNVQTSTKVVSIEKVSDSEDLPLFSVKIAKKPLNKTEILLVRYVVWAAGEFQYPRASAAKKEQHEEKKSEQEDNNNDNRKEMQGVGLDSLLERQDRGSVVRAGALHRCPSLNRPRKGILAAAQPHCAALCGARRKSRGFRVTAKWKVREEVPHAPLRNLVNEAPTEPMGQENTTVFLHTQHPPVLCTGFEGSVAASASHLFEFADSSKTKKGCLNGAPLLTENDESTKIPGVFLVGPTVSHGTLSFCFVYKFRQRFAVVANSICGGLGIDTRAAVAECRKANMYRDEFSCCSDTCGDVC